MKELKSYGMKLLYKWSPQQFLVELLSKRWAEAIFPFLIMLVLVPVFGSVINGYFSLYNAVSLAREFSEFYFVAMAMALASSPSSNILTISSWISVEALVPSWVFVLSDISAKPPLNPPRLNPSVGKGIMDQNGVHAFGAG